MLDNKVSQNQITIGALPEPSIRDILVYHANTCIDLETSEYIIACDDGLFTDIASFLPLPNSEIHHVAFAEIRIQFANNLISCLARYTNQHGDYIDIETDLNLIKIH